MICPRLESLMDDTYLPRYLAKYAGTTTSEADEVLIYYFKWAASEIYTTTPSPDQNGTSPVLHRLMAWILPSDRWHSLIRFSLLPLVGSAS